MVAGCKRRGWPKRAKRGACWGRMRREWPMRAKWPLGLCLLVTDLRACKTDVSVAITMRWLPRYTPIVTAAACVVRRK